MATTLWQNKATGETKTAKSSPGPNWTALLSGPEGIIQSIAQLIGGAAGSAVGGDIKSGNFSPSSWLSSMGGAIGSGLDAAFTSFLTDLWDVILGPLEIIAGVVLAFIILMWIFRDDLAAVTMMVVR